MSRARSAILTYHSLDDSGSAISTSPDVFSRQMAWLASSGLPVVPLHAVHATPGSVALTFDDGFANFATDALPVLTRYHFPATVFVVSGFCGRTNRWPGQPASIPELPLMDWPALQTLASQGVGIGAHTVSHPRLPALSGSELTREVEASRAAIEDHVGVPVDTFAYPYGASTSVARDLVRRRFRLAVGTRLHFVGDDDMFDLPRLDSYYLRRFFWFERLMSSSGGAYLGVRRLLRSLRACLSPSS